MRRGQALRSETRASTPPPFMLQMTRPRPPRHPPPATPPPTTPPPHHTVGPRPNKELPSNRQMKAEGGNPFSRHRQQQCNYGPLVKRLMLSNKQTPPDAHTSSSPPPPSHLPSSSKQHTNTEDVCDCRVEALWGWRRRELPVQLQGLICSMFLVLL